MRKIEECTIKLQEYRDEINEIRKVITNINKDYNELLIKQKIKYNLTQIDIGNKTSIEKKLKCGDNHILTVLWLNVLNVLKKKYNPTAPMFPIVFDDVIDRDFDNINEKSNIEMSFDLSSCVKQVIISQVKFDASEYPNREIALLVNLSNPQYSLLTNEGYTEGNELCQELFKVIVS